MKPAMAKNRVEETLEALRTQMMETAKEYGMQHPLVLYYSREIDRVHTALLTEQYGTLHG
ncbi:Spo0E family sporulation regulatory protein-aspartic acid phosphatase [Salicibibacter kimchii]|uniref:Aspartyl-phosphate phosphatase Spo0E family protein n=1 Tax=Salicibibacter kimchii TaxID=2099786 RepID=A0A345C400_9BACI|nr:Spo0E family sporulation regulatory protein-aspartic acid phosphatase [Salicibibacter kimchii]AXF57931.1 aspartyl-phosphate phosphatase Spo0E family protein [Salicibibacter kimchii]